MPGPAERPLTPRDVLRTWLPLAASWLLMGFELPLVSAILARLDDARVHLAAYGGVVFPLALLIEAPIIMLLAASTALVRDRTSYAVGRRFMLVVGLGLTALHALIAFTPLFDLVVGRWIAPPADVLEPARLGLRIMTPWTISIAYRRYQQGTLIRFGHSNSIGVGTAVRFATNATVLFVTGFVLGWPGIAVGTAAVVTSVMAEAIYIAIVAHPVLISRVFVAPAEAIPLTMARFLRFYVPLMMTTVLLFFAMPLTTAAMTRMPRALDSLAAWPVLNGLLFSARSVAFALNEVTVSMLDRPGAGAALRAFTRRLALALSGVLVLFAATPIGALWFGRVSALPPALADLARHGLWLALAVPALTAFQSFYQGVIVHSHETRGVTEAVVVMLLTNALVLFAGIAYGRLPALDVGLIAFTTGALAQYLWLRARAKPALAELRERSLRPAGSL